MKQQNVMMRLQKKYKHSGYALIAPTSGTVVAFEKNIKRLYQTIKEKRIKDSDKVVMYIPSPYVKHIFRISLPLRIH